MAAVTGRPVGVGDPPSGGSIDEWNKHTNKVWKTDTDRAIQRARQMKILGRALIHPVTELALQLLSIFPIIGPVIMANRVSMMRPYRGTIIDRQAEIYKLFAMYRMVIQTTFVAYPFLFRTYRVDDNPMQVFLLGLLSWIVEATFIRILSED